MNGADRRDSLALFVVGVGLFAGGKLTADRDRDTAHHD